MAPNFSRAGSSIAIPVKHYHTKLLANVVEFIFKYRSREQLIANETIPAPVQRETKKRSAPPEDVDVQEVSDSSEEEAKAEAVLATIRAKRAKKRVKCEDDVDVQEAANSSEEEAKAIGKAVLAIIRAKQAKKRVKREVKEEPDIKPVLPRGQVIDLT